MILLYLFEPWRHYVFLDLWRPIQRCRCQLWGLPVFACERQATSAWLKYLSLCSLVRLCVLFCHLFKPVSTSGLSSLRREITEPETVSKSLFVWRTTSEEKSHGDGVDHGTCGKGGKKKNHPERTEITFAFQTGIFFRVLFQPLFCWMPSSMQSTAARLVSSQSADDVGAPSERMLLVPLPWRFGTCREDALALANSVVTRTAQMRNHQERKRI